MVRSVLALSTWIVPPPPLRPDGAVRGGRRIIARVLEGPAAEVQGAAGAQGRGDARVVKTPVADRQGAPVDRDGTGERVAHVTGNREQARPGLGQSRLPGDAITLDALQRITVGRVAEGDGGRSNVPGVYIDGGRSRRGLFEEDGGAVRIGGGLAVAVEPVHIRGVPVAGLGAGPGQSRNGDDLDPVNGSACEPIQGSQAGREGETWAADPREDDIVPFGPVPGLGVRGRVGALDGVERCAADGIIAGSAASRVAGNVNVNVVGGGNRGRQARDINNQRVGASCIEIAPHQLLVRCA